MAKIKNLTIEHKAGPPRHDGSPEAVLGEYRAVKAAVEGELVDRSEVTGLKKRIAELEEELQSAPCDPGRRPVPEDRTSDDARRPNYEDRAVTPDGHGFSLVAPKARAITRGERWLDQDGREVAVLSPEQRMADLSNRALNVTLGDCLRGLALGPRDVEMRDALAQGSDSAGGFTVAEPVARQFIDQVRARTAAIRAGARTVAMTTEKQTIARVASDPVAAWRLENEVVADGDMTFSGVSFHARSLAVLVKASVELLEDSLNAGEALTGALAGAMAVEVDRVAMTGSGVAPEPKGIINTVGVTEITPTTYGAFAADELVDLVTAVRSLNHEPTAVVWHPRTEGIAAKLKGSDGHYLGWPAYFEGLPRLSSGALPVDLTADGGAVAGLAPVIAGDFTQLLLGVRSNLRIMTLRERYADYLQVGFLAHLRLDVAVAHPKAFAFFKTAVA